MHYLICTLIGVAVATSHHRNNHLEPRQDTGGIKITINNKCPDTIWPGIAENDGRSNDGFELAGGDSKTITVASDWKGRIWGRTNCTFPDGEGLPGKCTTGECGALKCRQAGNPPATLAEFEMSGAGDQAYYDLSLVDGYNLPVAIVVEPNNVSALANVKLSQKNPSCVGSVDGFAAANFNPYSDGQQFLGTSDSDKLPFEMKTTLQSMSTWCPFDLLTSPPTVPGNGVYPYPDGNVKRPPFSPCISACNKYNKAKYCCTGRYDRGHCNPNYYSKAAKAVCPDAYSYPHDDTDSMFGVPRGGNWEVVFCPGGRSTNIIAGTGGKD
ncbi:Putative Thaumatin family [Septoria linicola]|uniref:Thaumatin family n=1 Tax=Septoria linicola TaxID=215465 RepID=A0A9Q9AJE9_9PEZI|nr:putative Thaumatin family [Septoria linicola]USW50449.1 Putative Thaumatin family [Septoria linicola]